MNLIKRSILAVFPETNTENLTGSTRLADVPGWDSMNAVNLQIEIETALESNDLNLKLYGKTTVQELEEDLKRRGFQIN